MMNSYDYNYYLIFTDFVYFRELYKYLIVGTYYEFISSVFQSSPFFWVWLATVVVWFFLEITIWAAKGFNTKHTYINTLSRKNILGLMTTQLYMKKLTLVHFLRCALKFV